MEEISKTYSIREVSEKIKVPEGTLRQWEKDFAGVLFIARYKGSRYYTNFDIETLMTIKEWRADNLPKEKIRQALINKKERTEEEPAKTLLPTIPHLTQSEAVESLQKLQHFPEEMKMLMTSILGNMKEELKKEIREEIRNEVKNEVMEEIIKELKSSSEQQEKLLATGQNQTAAQIEKMSELIKELKDKKQGVVELEPMQEKTPEKKGFFKKLFKS